MTPEIYKAAANEIRPLVAELTGQPVEVEQESYWDGVQDHHWVQINIGENADTQWELSQGQEPAHCTEWTMLNQTNSGRTLHIGNTPTDAVRLALTK